MGTVQYPTAGPHEFTSMSYLLAEGPTWKMLGWGSESAKRRQHLLFPGLLGRIASNFAEVLLVVADWERLVQ
jgi:hypothetical protein